MKKYGESQFILYPVFLNASILQNYSVISQPGSWHQYTPSVYISRYLYSCVYLILHSFVTCVGVSASFLNSLFFLCSLEMSLLSEVKFLCLFWILDFVSLICQCWDRYQNINGSFQYPWRLFPLLPPLFSSSCFFLFLFKTSLAYFMFDFPDEL